MKSEPTKMLIFSLIFLNIVFCVVAAADTNESGSPKAIIDLFNLMMKSLSNAIPETSEGCVSLAYTCENGTIPTSFNTDSKGLPFVLCKEIDCLENNKIHCTPNVSMNSCNGENKWVNGFYERFENGYNSTKVQCCQYKDAIQMKFLRKLNVTKNSSFTRDEVFENVAFNIFNDVEMHGNDENETIYSISVYQMTCPGFTTIVGDKTIHKLSTDNSENENLESLKSLASSAREIGLKIGNSKPKPKFNENPFLSNLASKFVDLNRDPYEHFTATRISPPPESFSADDFMTQPFTDGFFNVRDFDENNFVGSKNPYKFQKIKWNPYIPKPSSNKQHIYSNTPHPTHFELFE